MQGWLKVYYRNEKGVMVAIDGVKILPSSTIRLDKSVYSLESMAGNKYWMEMID